MCVRRYGYAYAIWAADDNEELARALRERADTAEIELFVLKLPYKVSKNYKLYRSFAINDTTKKIFLKTNFKLFEFCSINFKIIF